MKVENTEAQMRKGILDYCILLIIAANDSYASDIINRLKEAGLLVVEGTIYPLMTRLKNAGWVTYRWEESQQGPPRKYYTITDEGKAFLGQLDNVWNSINGCVTHIKTSSNT